MTNFAPTIGVLRQKIPEKALLVSGAVGGPTVTRIRGPVQLAARMHCLGVMNWWEILRLRVVNDLMNFMANDG